MSFPAGRVSKTLDGEVSIDYTPRNPYDAWNWERYDCDAMDGHHVGLQIVGRRFEEEKILGAAMQFERLLQSL